MNRISHLALLMLFTLFIFATVSKATTRVAPTGEIEVPRVHAAPQIDGVMHPPEWEQAARFTLDYQIQPGDNQTPSEKTEVWIAYDQEYLYFAFHAHDSDASLIRGRITRRDDIFADDYVSIYLDPSNDRRNAYSFFFNPLGIQADGIYTDSSNVNRFSVDRDLTWDGILESRGIVSSHAFTVEVAIPFRSLNFPKDPRPWGFHVQRWIARKAERISWQPIPRTSSGLLIQMGTIYGIQNIRRDEKFDLTPTLVASADSQMETQGLENDYQADPGLTANWKITGDTILSAAVNPDFSQVESDVPQIEVNQRFPLFFPEKRPFFLESTEIFRSPSRGGFTLVDTRRIIDPHFGGKLIGHAGKNGFGYLSAVDNAQGLQLNPANPGYEDNATFNIFRYQRNFLQDSYAGAFLTDYRFAGSSNTLVAADGRIRLTEKDDVGFQAIQTWTNPTEGKSLSGGAVHLRYSHEGKPWRLLFYSNHIDSDFNNSVGFTRRAGFNSHVINLGYEILPQNSSWYVSIRPFVVAKYLRTAEGFLDESFFDPGFDVVLPRGISIYAYYSFDQANFTGEDLHYSFTRAYVTVETFRKFILDTNFLIGEGVNFDPARPVIGSATEIQISLTWKPNARLDSEFLFLKSRLEHKITEEELFDQQIYRNRTVWQFNKNHGIRSILEYDSLDKRFSVSELYSFTPSPGTAIYAGYGDVFLDDPEPFTALHRSGFTRIQRTFFVKVSYNTRF
jgi:hypothetical protein